MGCLLFAESARSAAGEAAAGPIGCVASFVEVVVVVLDELSFPRTMSQITKAAATASATTAPIRMLDRRAQPVSRGSLTPRKNRSPFGGRNRQPFAFESGPGTRSDRDHLAVRPEGVPRATRLLSA